MSLSNGGNASQSSWYELLPEKDGLRDSRGLPGFEAVKTGVLIPSGGDDAVEEVFVVVRVISGDRPPTSAACSGFEPGIGIGSVISNMVRVYADDDETPKDTLRSKLPPFRTKQSAMMVHKGILTRKSVARKTRDI